MELKLRRYEVGSGRCTYGQRASTLFFFYAAKSAYMNILVKHPLLLLP